MIFFSIGLPSRFAELCDNLTAELARRSLGSAEVVAVNTLDELAMAVIRTGCTNLVIPSREPVTALSHLVAQSGIRFLVALDDPRLALHDLVTRNGADFLEAVRTVARSCASMVGVASNPGALVLRAERDWGRRVVGAIADHFELRLGEEDLDAAAAELPEARPASGSGYDEWWAGLDETQRSVAAGALAGYLSYFAGNDLG
ncbi:MAG: hypothetical protein JO267_12945, partial [Alphaproteobacteria bacterium]|nr:hypothetical protein [Alphaproteobacteria bacterium]